MGLQLSDNAMRMWMAYFLNPKSTLRFGGEGAKMEITTEARSALDELLDVGAVVAIEADDSRPGREHYGGGAVDLRGELQNRTHLNPFTDEHSLVCFRAKEGGTGGTVDMHFSTSADHHARAAHTCTSKP